jgi:hypothetical protein
MALRHIVLIAFKPETSEKVQREIFNRYQTLDEDCGGKDAGILSWRVAWNLDMRKGIHLVEVADYVDNAALQAFRVHPKHQELTNILREVADWWVGDFLT